MQRQILVLLGLSVVGWSGCTNPINAHTARRYFEAAQGAEAEGDLPRARMLYSRAAGNTDLGHLDANSRAHAWFEYARLSGYLGEVAEAERTYERVLTLIDAGVPEAESLRAPTLAEYARLLQNNDQPQRASPLYARAVAALERVSAADSDPIGFALFLENYAQCLRSVGDAPEADRIKERANALRNQHPGVKAKFTNDHQYASAARAASERGDWAAARRFWQLANAAAIGGAEDPRFVAVTHYEYGRSLGVTGRFAEAETELKTALARDTESGGEPHWALTELARLNQAQHKYEAAAEYFERNLPILDAARAEQRNPADMAAFLADYAECLRHVGRTAEADQISARATALAATIPAGAAPADRTPYGTQTSAKKSG
ncbi:tetratricopeptide repeat protein [Opitutus sp. ER46]|uniref:tetratricopeptide repeat protein n=1 Tax=Opitutus sp. ER46 TaxID=2161864 RepID=UPI000D30685B|nr:tetratricopeptide repeat protein [Opitutus sp. ER46]PTY00371.1 hypothetical protein DB354_01815 [Opitutus sp. ER46]